MIGLSIAWELARDGAGVLVLEQGEFGRESSWAGAGMLPPGEPEFARSPEALLRSHSHRLWPAWSESLREITGIDNGFSRCGGIEARFGGLAGELDEEARTWQTAGVACELLEPSAARSLEPALGPDLTAAYRLAEWGQVRNPRHLKALYAACTQIGVTLMAGTPVIRLVPGNDRIVSVETPTGRFEADEFVVAGGAWSERLLATFGNPPWIRPMRGQIVLLNCLPSPLQQIVNIGSQYLVPRGDGRILVGSTEEDVGYDRRTTAAGIAELIALATRVAPCLADAEVERTWAGLRPRSIDGLPYLGRMPGVENLTVAAGHFRAGLQLSPVTAVLVSQIVRREPTLMPLTGLEPDRGGVP